MQTLISGRFFADDRRRQLKGAVAEGQKFWASLADMMQWVVDKQAMVDMMGPVSGQLDLVTKQNRDTEVSAWLVSEGSQVSEQ